MTIIISDEAVNIALNTWLGGVPAWRNDATERLRAEMRAALTAAAPHLASVRVKKLEWHGPDYEDEYWASWLGGRYTIQANTDDGRWLGGVGGNFQSVDAAKAAAQADYEARILSVLEPSVCQTCNGHGLVGRLIPWGDGEVDSVCEPCPDCSHSAGRAAVLEEAASMLEAKAEAANSRAVAFTEKLSGPRKGRKQSDHWRSEKNHNERIKFYYLKAAAAIRALSSPDHADAGKVEGDGWLPIESAPKDGTIIYVWAEGFEWPETVKWMDFEDDKLKAEVGADGYWTYADELLADVVGGVEPELWTRCPPLCTSFGGRGMSKPKIIYARPGDMFEIRMVCHEDFDLNARDWREQTFPTSTLIMVVDSHGLAFADPITRQVPWPSRHPSGGDRHGE